VADPIFLVADCNSGWGGSILETQASTTATTAFVGPRNNYVIFPAGWAGGNLRFTFIDRYGATDTETFIGTPGTTQVGTKIYVRVTLVENLAPAGAGANFASFGYGRRIGASNVPVTAFLGLSDLVTGAYPSSGWTAFSTSEGWVDAGVLIAGIYLLQYTYTL
jgi:hypothetical protein